MNLVIRPSSTPTVIVRNYLKVALRSITRSKGYSFINIAGLAVGMCVTMLIGMWVYDELTFNQYHDNFDRIGEISQSRRCWCCATKGC